MIESNWIKEHKRLVLEYSKLKVKKTEISKRMKGISKELNKLDNILIKGE